MTTVNEVTVVANLGKQVELVSELTKKRLTLFNGALSRANVVRFLRE